MNSDREEYQKYHEEKLADFRCLALRCACICIIEDMTPEELVRAIEVLGKVVEKSE